MSKKIIFTVLLAVAISSAKAQQATIGSKPKHVKSVIRGISVQNIPDTLHNPRKAVMRSLMVPGWGQIYNRQWWKVPIVCGGLGLIGSAVIFNQNYYSQFLTIAKYRRRGEQPAPGDKYYKEYMALKDRSASDAYVESTLNSYRRNRDLAILGMLGGWGIQMIDAYIDAKFINSYSMDDNLSYNIRPSLINQAVYASGISNRFIPSLKFTATF
ncbi:DUF5683 domain-containing protein [Mucilaginibacter roseus]|uniref:DUF5683 domain-containing protein n=1 Tax=Mucilaginibacter roseus TaxID=1528868 RepID=A0ABS8U747_9SPHI|nr:DUF5683 domain-containing protein [Mucilaginibacter roseus]MCD8741383.1 DUF5683 domain-containing protein [Mucilaginibacter roseus]